MNARFSKPGAMRSSRSRAIIRTLKRVTDIDSLSTITSDDLLDMPLADYQQLRREVTLRKLAEKPRFLCSKCEYPVYAPRLRDSGPYWKHFSGAPHECPWWTGDPASTDDVSKHQFRGRQESPLHYRLKHLIAELMALDARYSNIIVDEYFKGSDGRRRPDVRADYTHRPIAFELQLSTTQLPIILERELFYERERRNLVWLTWDFLPCPLAHVRQAFLDIRTAHNDNLFTLDAGTIAESRCRGTFVFRVFWWQGDRCLSKLVTVDELLWRADGLGFAVAPPVPWGEDFKARWSQMPIKSVNYYMLRRELWEELAARLGFPSFSATAEEAQNLVGLLNCLLSIEIGRPIGSDQSNLFELLNTFFYAKDRSKYANIVEFALRASGKGSFLERQSVLKKLREAKTYPQEGKGSHAARLVRALFPSWLDRQRLSQSSAGQGPLVQRA